MQLNVIIKSALTNCRVYFQSSALTAERAKAIGYITVWLTNYDFFALMFISENWSVTKECFSQISISYCTQCYKTAHTVLIISFKSHNFFYNIFSNFSFNCPRSSWGFQQKPPSITKFENWIRVSNVQLALQVF